MIQNLIPQLMPIFGAVLDKSITDKDAKQKALAAIESAIVDNAHSLNLETIKTNQTEAAHRSVWVAGWRPGVGWVLAFSLFWMLVGYPILTVLLAFSGIEFPLPQIPAELLFDLIVLMLGMSAVRSFDKLKGLSK